MLFEDKHFGKPISEELSQYLMKWTTIKNRSSVFEKTGISVSLLSDVIARRRNITRNNSIGILQLMEIAVQNCNNKIAFAKEAKGHIEKVLQCQNK